MASASTTTFSKYSQLHYFPRIACVWFLSAVIISYVFAVANNHVPAFLPFVSDIATLPPESCIFGQMSNIGAAFNAVLVYIWYRQVNIAINATKTDLPLIWNKVGLWSGNIFCLGISVAGNCQQTSLLMVHVISGSVIFGGIGAYLFVQTRISYALTKNNDKYPQYVVTKCIFYTRALLTSLFFIFLITATTCIGTLLKHKTVTDIFLWYTEEPYHSMRIMAAISEWLMIFIFNFYALTATKEFKSIKFEGVNFKGMQAVSKAMNKKFG